MDPPGPDVQRVIEHLRYSVRRIPRIVNSVSRDIREVRAQAERVRLNRRGRFMSHRVFREIAVELHSVSEAFLRSMRLAHEAMVAVRRGGLDERSVELIRQFTVAYQDADRRHTELMNNYINRLERNYN